MKIDNNLKPSDLSSGLTKLFGLAGKKVRALDKAWDTSRGTPVFTAAGKYTSRGWTEWTQGFQYGCALLTFDATGEQDLLEIGRKRTIDLMTPHITHIGVHDHGFNNLSTYGNLRRLMKEGRIADNAWEMAFYELALKASGAVQASRWADVIDGGFVYSFNGPHSLFVDTLRTIRILGVAHQLGHVLMGENDRKINLLARSVIHALTSAKYSVYYGEGRDGYDVPELRGRTTHEAVFNRNDGRFRCPNSQQGFSPFSTWTRGLAWAMVGYAEEIEFIASLPESEFGKDGMPAKADILKVYEKAAKATCDFYINQAAAADGIVYWDTGAANILKLGDYRSRNAEPYNDFEPVDASASAIAAQGLLRLGHYLGDAGKQYMQAGLAVTKTLLTDDYLAVAESHQGLLLHSVYHRPNGWDYIPAGKKVPCGESSMWGDYHLLETAVYVHRLAKGLPYLAFFDAVK